MLLAVVLTMAVLFLLSFVSELMMRMRLTKLEVRSEKLSWWSFRGGDEVAAPTNRSSHAASFRF